MKTTEEQEKEDEEKRLVSTHHRTQCPDWHHGDGTDAIIDWASGIHPNGIFPPTAGLNFVLEWSDSIVDVEGNKVEREYPGHWTMVWKHGVINFYLHGWEHNDGETRVRARDAAALFIYLWCKEIDPSIAVRLAELWVVSVNYDLCSECNGYGIAVCSTCNGSGMYMSERDRRKKDAGSTVQARKCPDCGDGKNAIHVVCSECDGSGKE